MRGERGEKDIQTDKQREIKLLVFSTWPSIFIDTGSFKSMHYNACSHETSEKPIPADPCFPTFSV